MRVRRPSRCCISPRRPSLGEEGLALIHGYIQYSLPHSHSRASMVTHRVTWRGQGHVAGAGSRGGGGAGRGGAGRGEEAGLAARKPDGEEMVARAWTGCAWLARGGRVQGMLACRGCPRAWLAGGDAHAAEELGLGAGDGLHEESAVVRHKELLPALAPCAPPASALRRAQERQPLRLLAFSPCAQERRGACCGAGVGGVGACEAECHSAPQWVMVGACEAE